jgi:hypothetical protein
MSKTNSGLTAAATPLTGAEVVYLVQGGNSRRGTTASFYIPGGTDVALVDGGTGASTASGARANLGLAIGTDVQAYSANLALWSAVTPASYLTTAAAAAAYQPLDSDLTSWASVTRAAGFDTFAATPTSANLRALLTDEVGTGAAYFVGGALGTPASGTATNLTGLPIGTGVSGLATNMATFLAGGTSAQLAATVTDETGSGALVFGTAPTFTTSLTMTSGVVLGANYMANYTGNLGLTTASLQSPLVTNAAFYLHGTTTSTNQNFLSQLELISDSVSNILGGAVANDYHIEATANSGSVWSSAGTVQLDTGFAFGTYSAFAHEAGINNLAGEYSDIGTSASIGVSLNGLGYRNSAAIYVNNMQQTITTTSATAAGSAVLTFSGGVPAWFKAGGVVTDVTNGAVIPAGTTMLSKTATTMTLSANVTGAGVASGDVIQIAQPLWYQGIKFAQYGVAQYSINDQSNSVATLNIAGSHTFGIDFSSATISSAAIRLGVGVGQGITARFSGTDYAALHADAAGRPVFGNTTLGSQFDGTIGVGTTPSAATGILIAGTIANAAGNALGVNSTPTLAPASGAAGVFLQAGGAVATGGNTIAGAYAAYLSAPTKSGGGTITTAYTLFLENPTSGTTNYSLLAAGSIMSNGATNGIGYATGAGGTVTQATSKSTGVTLNKACGQITMNAAALLASTDVDFVLTNTAIAATDLLVLNHVAGGTGGSYSLNARCAAGSATINVRNVSLGSLSEAVVIGFAVIKAVTA